jgi:carboxypeptidase family protein
MFRKLALVFTVGLVLAFAGVVVAQQVTGNISGTVKDSSGAVVPNATVTITNTDKNVVVRTTKTSDVGQYSAPLLPVGTYAVTVEANGFTKMSRNSIALNVNDVLTVDFSLQVGGTEQTVTVEAAPLAVDMSSLYP